MQPLRISSYALVLVLIVVGAGAVLLNFSKQPIDTAFPGDTRPFDVLAADMNNDGATDIVMTVVDFVGAGERLVWYENNGSEVFAKHVVDSTLASPGRIDVVDVDGDTNLDVLLEAGAGVYWYEGDGTGKFERRDVDAALPLSRMVLGVDLDEDTDMDVLALSSDGIYWEENDGSENFTRHLIYAATVNHTALAFGDFDGDLDIDVVSSHLVVPINFDFLVWYENDGSENFTVDVVEQITDAVTDLEAVDLDRNGTLDFVVTLETGNEIDWYQNNGSAVFTVVPLQTDFIQAPRALKATDADNDSDIDLIVVGGNSAIGEVDFYENDGFQNFTKRIIDNTAGNRERVFVSDIDGDTRDDLLVTNRFPMQLVLYSGLGTGTGVGTQAPTGARLGQNHPNPFNPATVIPFELVIEARVRLDVYSAEGRRIRGLADRVFAPGAHVVAWDGRTDDGRAVASGVYFYRLQAGEVRLTRKMTLLK